MNLLTYEYLIKKFKDLPSINKPSEPTFFEILGFSTYENVYSNMLKFFFDSKEAHNMNDIFVKSLLKIIGEDTENKIIEVDEVIREVTTIGRKRIDLVIITEDYIIGIENKIFAGLYNQFDVYSHHLDNMDKSKKVFKILLSVKKTPDSNSEFKNITYSRMFKEIKKLLKDYELEKNDKYYILLQELITTIDRLEKMDYMDPQILNFLLSNQNELEKILDSISEMKRFMRMALEKLSASININNTKVRKWFHKGTNNFKMVLVYDVDIENAVIAIDVLYKFNKWEIEVWLRKSNGKELSNRDTLSYWLLGKGINENDIITKSDIRSSVFKEVETNEQAKKYLVDLFEKVLK